MGTARTGSPSLNRGVLVLDCPLHLPRPQPSQEKAEVPPESGLRQMLLSSLTQYQEIAAHG